MSEREIKGKSHLEGDDKGGAGTTGFILQSVNPRGRSSASLPDGTVLVAFQPPALSGRSAGSDCGRLPPDSWLEGWRPGSMEFALRARLGIAAGSQSMK